LSHISVSKDVGFVTHLSCLWGMQWLNLCHLSHHLVGDTTEERKKDVIIGKGTSMCLASLDTIHVYSLSTYSKGSCLKILYMGK
jgi:hypothetical protein